MIPPRVLRQLAERLTDQTRNGTVRWSRPRHDFQRYTSSLSKSDLVVTYSPSRGGSDTIEFAVTEHGGEVIGSLAAQENEPTYDTLADLLFEIQRKSDPQIHGGVAEEILRMLEK